MNKRNLIRSIQLMPVFGIVLLLATCSTCTRGGKGTTVAPVNTDGAETALVSDLKEEE